MTITEIWSIAGAVIASVGGSTLIVVGCSTWLGKVWANRILEADKAKYQSELENLKVLLAKGTHEFNVATSRIDIQRSDAIKELYGALIDWYDIAIEIMAPNEFLLKKQPKEIVSKYIGWAGDLRSKANTIEQLSMRSALYFTDESYQILARCGIAASNLSNEFYAAAAEIDKSKDYPSWDDTLKPMMNARETMKKQSAKYFQPPRAMLVGEFRSLMLPPTPR